ncbi:NAD(P)H-dependent oxidoreductase [Fibrella sp. HMF5335]|uniref:NAD(P)H-dependent oxidoreductase n=1 Tax=Fibrella rubiginis TaxID=2817060 RepID=A0A939K3N2_9BACT|nr:NADPH-dependent FMN reductase [Fibrella rubiginis]MBO0935798.1 NAD(P)H-dependent oxidoreductase [Fibrella rubiginis]
MTSTKAILGVSGSLRQGSTNALLLRAVADRLPSGAVMTVFDGLDDLHHFSPERDADHENGTAVLPAVARWREAIARADAVLISTPEYAFGIPGVLKNALDWAVSTILFDRKPMGVLCASPGFEGGHKAMASLLPTLTALNTHIPEGCSLVISSVRKKMDNEGQVTDAATAEALSRLGAQLVGASE